MGNHKERSEEMQEKSLNIHCDKNGIRVQGARNIGSTSDTDASSKSDFLRICEVWWNTYVRGYTGSKGSGRDLPDNMGAEEDEV